MKKWISRSIVLAMIIALMVPMPVAAKSSKGGKLVKSVTYYSYNTTTNRWRAESKMDYTYDKKGNPTEVATTNYWEYLLSVPVRGTKQIETAKYKYKGKNAKSSKFKDGSGNVTEARKYKSGRAVSSVWSKKTSAADVDYDTEPATFKGDEIYTEDGSVSLTYDKKGLVTAASYAGTNSVTYTDGTSESESIAVSDVYAVTQKKGIPSYILGSNASFTRTWKDKDGSTGSVQRAADGTVTVVTKDGTASYKPDYVENYYTICDSKGLATEVGEIRTDTKTGAQKTFPRYRFEYASKKGVVKTATVYKLDTDENGVVTKATPCEMYSFKYTKKKASAVRYLSMVNDLVGVNTIVSNFGGYTQYANGVFVWY